MDRKSIENRLAKIRTLQDKKQKSAERQLRLEFKQLLGELRQVVGEEFAIHANEKDLSYEVLQKSGRLETFLERVSVILLLISIRVPPILKEQAEVSYQTSWKGLSLATGSLIAAKPYKLFTRAFANITNETLAVALSKNPLFGDYDKYTKELTDDLQKSIIKEIKTNIGIGTDLSNLSKTITERTQKAYRRTVQASRTTTHTFSEAGLGDAAKGLDEGFKAVKSYSEDVAKTTAKKAAEVENIAVNTEKALAQGRPLPLLDVPNMELAIPKPVPQLKVSAKAVGAPAKAQITAINIKEVFEDGEVIAAKTGQELPSLRMYKEWRSMRDQRVRKNNKANHRKMDGVSIPVKERFDLGRGVTTDVPGNSGDPANDIRCRCILIYDLKEG